MARGKTFKKRLLSVMMTILMVAAIAVPSFPSYAVADTIDVGQPGYNASGVMTYYNCLGTGTNLYKSLVINFTSVRENGEKIILPSVSGFTYETSLSTDGTYIINIPEGKNLVQIAAYIRKIQFLNCQNSSQKINFSVGKDIVKYMTFYSEDSQHYYQFIKFDKASGTAVKDPTGKSWSYGSWEWAYYTALNMTYEGLQGYLATVSTVEEDAFIYRCSNEIGWLGGTKMTHGEADSKNGIPFYKTFTPSGNGDGIGYWYWAVGPDVNEGGGKFLQSPTAASNSVLQTADSKGYYNNWNNGEPNNSNGEFSMTTLKIGSGWSTGNRNGKIGTNSPYYVASGYSWNDIVDTNWAQYGSSKVTSYTATGFFVEYGDYVKGLTQTALVQKTNFEFKTTTQPLNHIWNLYAADGSDTIHMFCSASDPKCSYYAVGASSLGETIDLTIQAADVPYDGRAYSSSNIVGADDIMSATNNTANISDIKYYKVSTADTVTGGTIQTAPPTAIGYYYAEVTVTIKNTVLASNTVSAKAVVPFKIYDPNAEYAVESLNNKAADKETVPYQRKVTETTAYADLEVVLATVDDRLSMYKLAEMTWDDEADSLKDMEWVSQVKNWINQSSYAATAATPYDLSNGKASSSTIASFYKDMLRVEGYDVFTTAGDDQLVDLYATPSGQYASKGYKYVDADNHEVSEGADGAKEYSMVFDNIQYGIYAILATDGNNNPYAVTVASVYPQQSGPQGAFFTQELFTVYIKEVEPTIEKKINGQKQDVAEINDTANPIEFTIDFQLPQYKDRLTTGSGSGYQLSFEDLMAEGFTLYEPDEEHRLALYYLYKDGENLAEARIDENSIPEATAYKFTENSQGSSSILLTEDNAKDGTIVYIANPSDNTILTKNSDLIGYYATPRTGPIFEQFTIPTGQATTNISISFDEPIIRAWKANIAKNEDRAVSGFRIRYYAILDQDAKINSNENTNTAYIHYEKDSNGRTMTEMHDVVHAYTYGLNIVKIDGSASTTTYLSGAEFNLYKELSLSDADYEALESAEKNNYYVLPGENDEASRYFKKVSMNNGIFQNKYNQDVYDTLISVNTEQGITAHGLGVGSYVLVESKAPAGYNELAEDIYFEINQLNDGEMAKADNSYIWFREMETDDKPYSDTDPNSAIINENGCIKVDVYNYQGLVLPSTGGIGILLFIIIGTGVMGAVIVIILGRRKRQMI
ncbi:SpaA isopeptide-forming pilin-related protein [Pseudobutyrivibrio xylanivorans]|uniref:LPXTG-motif cell wall anchor domain-containing protein n=1 Tax=Pseudobutyrivibrio xylanivorans DSM 14809 TaxID=1123012 RepID=A0A1M6B9Y4_PSEXY|nr:SpaA isopeptide-forming pilin-related protein [Pseudobutyrivibrio xylanivorans]SHI45525.1 LPXTG-motif cell wall anchor domain-containing protein [Pseudobutyrivibrio xylanivorans DSM 14809]